jgi:recombination protein RecR
VETVRACSICHNWTEDEVCSICRDSRRDASLLCVVETPKDLASFERAATFRGRYHVLGGKLAPLDDVGPDELEINSLINRVRGGGVRELILATSPTLEGDGTALFIANMLAMTEVRITRLARGIPSGSSLDYVNSQMLTDALEGRRSI